MATASMSGDLPGTIEKEYYARFFGNLAHHRSLDLAAIDHAHHRGMTRLRSEDVRQRTGR